MNHKKILAYLYSLESPSIKLGLERVQSLLDKTGNPEKSLKCIHVAGTNGKGSVCAMLFYILKDAGYKVGLYTSPHLKRFNERIRVNEHFITDREIVDYFLMVKPHITNQSFFEITNVVIPLVSVITNIGHEHTDLLGNTIEKIAFEKAGIIKNNVPVATAAKGKALRIIKKIAKERNAPLYPRRKYPKIKLTYLNGNFQQENKDIALTTINALKKYYPIKINQKQIINGLKKTQWHGRLEFISKNVLVDCAHNADGFKTLKKELETIKKQREIRNFIFVVGIQKDKNVKLMLKTINPLISTIIFTKSKHEKAAKPKELLKIFNNINKNKQIKTMENPKKALSYAKKIAGKNDLIVVAGSIYMVGEIL
ncbi:hypothetical protein HYY71_06185 [Candidatus Woesearchaeota archaeon]|nr:hypothetical protein [Candidatus Woesearchaeota archaeon]